MGASDNYNGVTTNTNSNGTLNGFTYSSPSGLDPETAKQLGLPASNQVSMQNPGSVDLSQTNPALYNQISQLQQYQNQFRQGTLQQVMDPNRYNDLRDEMAQRQQAQLGNQYAHMGLAGSSAQMGGIAENGRQLDFQMRDRQLGEQLRALQMEQGLSSQISGNTLQGQNQYAGFQQSYLNMIMGMNGAKQAQDAANSQMWGSVAQGALAAGGAIGGAMIGGPAGAVAGASAGSALGGGLSGAANSSNGYDQYSGVSGPSGGAPVASNPGYVGGGADYGYAGGYGLGG